MCVAPGGIAAAPRPQMVPPGPAAQAPAPNQVWVRVETHAGKEPGEVVTMDGSEVMHGDLAFKVEGGITIFLCGARGQLFEVMKGERQRDLFPFPVPVAPPTESVEVELSRGSLRRLEARRKAEERVRDSVVALNSMSAGDFVGDQSPTLSQRICLEKIRQPPEDLSGQGALNELRANAG